MSLGESRRRSLLVLAAGLVLAGGLAACTDGEGAEPEPTKAPTSAAPSGEPTAERPEVEKPVPPDAMARDDVAGAEAAAQYFLELYPYVYSTGDLAEWQTMSHVDCVFCASVVENVSELHDNEGSHTGGGYDVTKVESREPNAESEYYAVWVDANEIPAIWVESDGAPQRETGGGSVEIDMALERANDGWLVRGVEARAAGEG